MMTRFLLFCVLLCSTQLLGMKKNTRKDQEPKKPARQIARKLPDLLKKEKSPVKRSARLAKARPRIKPVQEPKKELPKSLDVEDKVSKMEISPRDQQLDEMLESLKMDLAKRDLFEKVMIAINQNEVTVLKELLVLNPDLEACDQVGRTPLVCAIFMGNEIMVEMLIKAGVNVNQDKVDPLSVARLMKNQKIIDLLIGTSNDRRLEESRKRAEKLAQRRRALRQEPMIGLPIQMKPEQNPEPHPLNMYTTEFFFDDQNDQINVVPQSPRSVMELFDQLMAKHDGML